MSVQDLTNTKWVLNDELDYYSAGGTSTVQVNYVSNGVSYNSIYFSNLAEDPAKVGYGTSSNLVYVNAWTNQAYRIISITGGTHATDSRLISWLEANAVQVPVVDLTGTEWLFNDTIYVNSGFTANTSYSETPIFPYSLIFTDGNDDQHTALGCASTNGIRWNMFVYQDQGIFYTQAYMSIWIDEAYKIISITGGTDVANPDLISWLAVNATIQTSQTTDFDLSSLTWSVGAHTIRVKAKGTGYRDSAFSTSVSYPIYEQLTTPIAVISGSRLSVSAVNHANGFEVYANDVLQATRPFTLGTNFDLDTLNLPTGTYTIKARCIDNTAGSYYTPSEMATAGTYTVLPQLDAPTNVSVSGTDATFDEVTNAESYEFFVDGTSIGTYTPASGYSVTIISGMFSDRESGNVYDTYDSPNESNFLVHVNDQSPPTVVTCTSGYLLIGADGGSDDWSTGEVSGGVTYVDEPSINGHSYYRYAVSGDGIIDGPQSHCFVEGTKILLTNGTTKNVEDITYDDELLVWNFYEGKLDSAKPRWIMQKRTASEYKRVLLSDGTELKLVGQGDNCHRLFNVTKQKMLYANECVGDEVATIHGIVTVLSCEKVQETVNYYNLTTEKYLDCFAEGVLTGSRLNNMYHISDMKYDSDERLISEEEEKERWAVRGMEVPK